LTFAPNPSNGIFKIDLSQPGSEIHFFDAMGKTGEVVGLKFLKFKSGMTKEKN
jgi:hypothetical protein